MNNSNQATLDVQRNALQDELREHLDTWVNQNENADWDVNPLLRKFVNFYLNKKLSVFIKKIRREISNFSFRIAELLEESTNDFMQNNPDPMDDRFVYIK